MVGSLLVRGMLVGVLAGLLAFAFARAFGEPQVDRAIAFEDQAAKAAGEAPEPVLVSRKVQAGAGLLTALVVVGAALGGIFALVFATLYGRVGAIGARALSALLAFGAFVSVSLVPQIKYPASPPAVGSPETISSRTSLYFALLAISVAVLIAAVLLAHRLWKRHGGWNATLIAGAAFIVVMAAVEIVLPAVNEVPKTFSADLLWRFRIASLGIHVILWTVLGVVFGIVAERRLAREHRGAVASGTSLH